MFGHWSKQVIEEGGGGGGGGREVNGLTYQKECKQDYTCLYHYS